MKKTIINIVLLLSLALSTNQAFASQCGNTDISVDFATDLTSFVATSSNKQISNIVVFFEDGTESKYDDLRRKEYTIEETETITKVCVKSGCNKSYEGPGYGECFDACPAQLISVSDVDKLEGNPTSGATTSFDFTVSLSETVPSDSCAVTLNYSTFDGSDDDAAPADWTDYLAVNDTLTIGAGQNSATITVPVITDLTVEGDEQFSLELALPSDSSNTLVNEIAIGTIINDDIEF